MNLIKLDSDKNPELTSVHLSSVALTPNSAGPITLYAKCNGEKNTIAYLDQSKSNFVKLDLYFHSI